VGCRATAEKAELTRVALVDGGFVVDAAQRLPGRGAYLHPGCATAALRTRGVQRTLRVPMRASAQLEALLAALASPPAGGSDGAGVV
jgi:predicted RNA-binding protein YlxR (DUF448 family)